MMSITPTAINGLYYIKRNKKYTTVKFRVFGYSSKCKARIEKSLRVNGIIKAKWNRETKMLTAIFNPEIVSFEQIQATFCMTAK